MFAVDTALLHCVLLDTENVPLCVLQCFQVALRLLDACSAAAAELQRLDFDRLIFQHLREEGPDQTINPVGPASAVNIRWNNRYLCPVAEYLSEMHKDICST